MPNTVNAIKGYIEKFVAFIVSLLKILGADELASQLEEQVG